ncbi:hypothetical protein AB1484_29810 [Parafrankia sp. FMc6]|uniref:hypothetical protein n=1 Tax=Parafrankia soli TaxID=2599596 RepID=UPI0034D462AF
MYLDDLVLVLDASFIPANRDLPYVNGIAAHAIHCADIIAASGVRVSFILHSYTEGITAPAVRETRILDQYPAVVVEFDVDIPTEPVARAFECALNIVAAPTRTEFPMVYHQSLTMIPFTSIDSRAIVTNHTPFVRHVADWASWTMARRTFTPDAATPLGPRKFEDLLDAEDRGLAALREREYIMCAEISALQVSWLRSQGIHPRRISEIPRPLELPAVNDVDTPPQPLQGLLATADVTAVTAVSQLNHFKNVELFVLGCCLALDSGDIDFAVMVGGPERDTERERIRQLVPGHLKDVFAFFPRLGHQALVRDLFRGLAGRGIFVCSSRFDLVPYTALEAARAGLCTIVADLPTVGARESVPDRYRFRPTPAGLAACLRRVAVEEDGISDFSPIAAAIRQETADDTFLTAFDNLCSRFSMPA